MFRNAVGARLTPSVPRVGWRTSARTAAAAAAAAVGWAVWAVHQPGIVNYDGLWILKMAETRTFEDWQPIYLTVGLSWLLPLGVKLWHLTLAQSVLVSVGVQRLGAEAARLIGAPPARAHAAGLAALALLLLPVSALPWYLPYFGSDGVVMTALVWYAVVFLSAARRPRPGRRAWVAAGIAAGVTLARPNAVVLVPVFATCQFVLHGRAGWRRAAVLGLAVAAVRPAAGAAVYAAYPVTRTHPIDQVMALDLVGVALAHPGAVADLPFTAAHLRGDRTRDGYAWGNVDPLYPWGHEPIVEPGFARGGHDPPLAEYPRAAARYPVTLLTVKVRGFVAHLLEPTTYWHNTGIDPNDQGVFHHPKRAAVREALVAVDRQVAASPVLQWVGGRHAVWLAAAVGGWLAAAYVCHRTGDRRAVAAAAALLVPLGYYLSYVAAITTNHYRLMMPATLLVQVAAAAVLFERVRRALDAVRPEPA